MRRAKEQWSSVQSKRVVTQCKTIRGDNDKKNRRYNFNHVDDNMPGGSICMYGRHINIGIMKEKDIQAKILNCLRQEKVYAVKVVLASKNGVPDIITCINGQFVAFEVKNGDKGKVTSLQEYNMEQIKSSLGLAFVVRSFDEFLEIYNSLNI